MTSSKTPLPISISFLESTQLGVGFAFGTVLFLIAAAPLLLAVVSSDAWRSWIFLFSSLRGF